MCRSRGKMLTGNKCRSCCWVEGQRESHWARICQHLSVTPPDILAAFLRLNVEEFFTHSVLSTVLPRFYLQKKKKKAFLCLEELANVHLSSLVFIYWFILSKELKRTLHGQKYVYRNTLHLYMIVQHLRPKKTALTGPIVLVSGFPSYFGTWLQGSAPMQPQEH